MLADPVRISTGQACRDLMWAITSSSLIDDKSMPSWALSATDFDADELTTFVNDRFSVPVGRYFEVLILFYLQHCLKVEIIAHGQQIQVDGRTVGELDFVFRNPAQPNAVLHVETAVKFYLHHSGDHHSGSHFIGPNPADNFESKLARLQNHQLPMSKQHAPDVTSRHPFVKGIVFHHCDESVPQQLPAGMTTSHCSGTWLHSNELHSLNVIANDSQTEIRFCVRRKPFWLSNAELPIGHPDLLTLEQIRAELTSHFVDGGKPQMLSVVQKNERCFTEQHRLFVVDEDWPHATTAT